VVYLDGTRQRLQGYNPRARHLRGLRGLGVHYPRHRYLTGMGCANCTRMLNALGQDIAPPDIGPSAPPPTPILITDISQPGPSSPAYGYGPTNPVGPATPPSLINTLPVSAPPPLVSASTPIAAPAIGYGAPGTAGALTAAVGATPSIISAVTGKPMAVQASAVPGTFLGIPTNALMYGGLAILALAALGAARKR
jgi:hypothetical protein